MKYAVAHFESHLLEEMELPKGDDSQNPNPRYRMNRFVYPYLDKCYPDKSDPKVVYCYSGARMGFLSEILTIWKYADTNTKMYKIVFK